MRLFVFFDLPMETVAQRRAYTVFRRGLIRNGFMMMQESVYCRLVLNPSIERTVVAALQKIKPNEGIVQLLTVTEKQYAKIQFLTGESNSDVIDSTERLIIL